MHHALPENTFVRHNRKILAKLSLIMFGEIVLTDKTRYCV